MIILWKRKNTGEESVTIGIVLEASSVWNKTA